jgi:GxxExxY protein
MEADMSEADVRLDADNAERRRLNALAEAVIGAAYEVSNTLGVGFLEKVYERALVSELGRRNILAEATVPVPVLYKGEIVGEYFADILVEGTLILELKCVEEFNDAHVAQCLNYLRATGLRMALLINFGQTRVRWKRIVHNF